MRCCIMAICASAPEERRGLSPGREEAQGGRREGAAGPGKGGGAWIAPASRESANGPRGELSSQASRGDDTGGRRATPQTSPTPS